MVDDLPKQDETKKVDKDVPRCLGCGHYHGSVNAEINCLMYELTKARMKLAGR